MRSGRAASSAAKIGSEIQATENMNWAASRPITDDGAVYQRHRINLDVGGSYRFARRVTGFFSVRNVLNEPFIRMEKMGDNPAVARFFQKFGVTPTIGVKTTF